MCVSQISLEEVGPDNIEACGIGCVVDRQHPGYRSKVEWLEGCFKQGLRLFLFRDAQGKPLGFIECVPGEHAWRPVDAIRWLPHHRPLTAQVY